MFTAIVLAAVLQSGDAGYLTDRMREVYNLPVAVEETVATAPVAETTIAAAATAPPPIHAEVAVAPSVAPNPAPARAPGPLLAELLADPSAEAALHAYVTDCQAVAGRIMQLAPEADPSVVRVVAQEFARLKVVDPRHPAVTQRERMLSILVHESRCKPTAMGRAGDAGLFQFIPSTCRWLGLDYGKMHSATPDAIRYQCRAAFRLLGMKSGGYWSQWSTDRFWRGAR